MTAHRSGWGALLATLAIATTACGEVDDGAGTTIGAEPELTAGEVRVVRGAPAAVQRYCAQRLEAIAEGRAPASVDTARVTRALDALAALAVVKPTAETPDGGSPRLALGDIAENLEGINCDPALVARIDATLADLSSP